MKHDLNLEYEALSAVADVQDGPQNHNGRAPNWELPPSIPSQRFAGLKRRGYLDSKDGRWWLTEQGCGRLDLLRALAGDTAPLTRTRQQGETDA